MDKKSLRRELMHELWRMNKMHLIVTLQEFVEGETATLAYLNDVAQPKITPSMISDNLRISRARAANILRSLRGKGFVRMDIAEDDRRKMYVFITDKGKKHLSDKQQFLTDYFDLYVEVLGEEDTKELIRLIRKTADNERLLTDESKGEVE